MVNKKKWIISQKWSHIFFLHFEVDREVLKRHLPHYLEPDEFNEKCYISIVPFYMSHIRFPFLPPLPFASLWELNLRTYVRHQEKSGIYFFTLDSNHRLGNFIARQFFALPYRTQLMKGAITDNHYQFHSQDSFYLKAKIQKQKIDKELSRWLTERYSLFTDNGKDILEGRVHHQPWELDLVTDYHFENHFSQQFGFELKSPISAEYSAGLDVYFSPFQKVGQL